jgi:hypothetical protein
MQSYSDKSAITIEFAHILTEYESYASGSIA